MSRSKKTFGELLRALREAALGARSKAALAAQLGVTPQYLGLVEAGKAPPLQPERLAQVAEALCLDPEHRARLAEAAGHTWELPVGRSPEHDALAQDLLAAWGRLTSSKIAELRSLLGKRK